ncbi:hypothetical protein CCVT_1751 [Campylobacter curvus]|nr:hypothetical protein CCVT_1751 [Campylobacter curvus]
MCAPNSEVYLKLYYYEFESPIKSYQLVVNFIIAIIKINFKFYREQNLTQTLTAHKTAL